VDPNRQVVDRITSGSPPIFEEGLPEIMGRSVRSGRLTASTTPDEALSKASVIIITVGTPVSRDRKPVLGHLDSAVRDVGRNLPHGSIVVLKSTVPPLTTENMVRPLLEELSGLVAGRDFGLAFVPERTVEGRAVQEFLTLPKIVGGIDQRSTRVASAFFSQLGGRIVPVSKPRTAETAKLFDNIYRDVNIALANELAMLCEHIGVDAIEAIGAANKDYARTHLLSPGPGVGGSCLTKDPYILLHSAGAAGDGRLIRTARSVNDGMPGHVVSMVEEALGSAHRGIRGAKIAILGYTFKGDTDDTRNTPVAEILRVLVDSGAEPAIFDPHVKEGVPGNVASLEEAVHEADCVVVSTDHQEFKSLTLSQMLSSAKSPLVVVDTRHLIDPIEASAKAIYRGVGRPPQAFCESGQGNSATIRKAGRAGKAT